MKGWRQRRRAKRARARAAGVRSWPRRLLRMPSRVPLTVEESIQEYNRKHPARPLDLYQQVELHRLGLTVEQFLASPIGLLPTGEMLSLRLWQKQYPNRAGLLGNGIWMWLYPWDETYESSKKCKTGSIYPFGYGPEADKHPGPSMYDQRYSGDVVYMGDEEEYMRFHVTQKYPPPKLEDRR